MDVRDWTLARFSFVTTSSDGSRLLSCATVTKLTYYIEITYYLTFTKQEPYTESCCVTDQRTIQTRCLTLMATGAAFDHVPVRLEAV
jgi:hypothetical protein